jgi:hypothetical protein
MGALFTSHQETSMSTTHTTTAHTTARSGAADW